MSRAKIPVIGAVVGLAIAGLAFVLLGVISRLIIEPAGGQRIVSDAGADCDQLLRNQLVFQRGASTKGRMDEVIRRIQAQRDDCVSEFWNPRVEDDADTDTTGCFSTWPSYTNPLQDKIGDLTIPRTLYTRFTVGTDVLRRTSGRDSDNNIFAMWVDINEPADASESWLYVSRLKSWDENY